MKNLTRTTKTILFASLIVAMILLFSGMSNSTFAEDDRKQKINKLGTVFEKVYLKYIDEDNPKAKAGLKKAMDNIVKDLEEYGVTYTEKWETDKKYWGEKSSKHIGEAGFTTLGNLLPVANAYTNPYFYAGAYYECWWILACPTWNNSGVQLGVNQSGTKVVELVEDSDWSEAMFKVTGSGIIVDYNTVSKLKDDSTIKDTQTSFENAYIINHSVSIDYSDD